MREPNKIRAVASVVVLLLTLAAGCSDDGNTGNAQPQDIGSDTGVDAADISNPSAARTFLEEWRTEYNAAACETIFGGCAEGVKLRYWEYDATRISSESECQEQLGSFEGVLPEDETVGQLVEDGHLDFDTEAASACLEAFRQARAEAECWLPSVSLMSQCRGVFAAHLGAGDTCFHEFACESGDCEADFDGDQCRVVCTEPTEIVEEGEACEQHPDPERCNATGELICDLPAGAEQTKVCVEQWSRQDGDPCQSDEVCAEGLVCDSLQCVSVVRGEVGDGCTIDGTPAPCMPELTCVTDGRGNPSGTCEEPGEVGTACDGDERCGIGLYCNVLDGTCAERVGENEECSLDAACEDGFYCGDTTTSKCLPQKQTGESCTRPGECLGARWCTDGACGDLEFDSDPCEGAANVNNGN